MWNTLSLKFNNEIVVESLNVRRKTNIIKKYIVLIIIGISLLSCSTKKYLLADETSENKRLIELVKNLKKEGKINKNPVVVINEKVIESEELKNLKIYNSEIIDISVIERNNTEMTQIYGEQSTNGILLIETKPFQEKAVRTISESKVLLLIDGKETPYEKIETIDPNDIESVTVIKDKKEISKYTSENYDGVIIIVMKKNERPTSNNSHNPLLQPIK